MHPLHILYEDNHLLVVDKPAPLPTQGAAEGSDSLVVRAKDYLKRKYGKPGNVYLGVVSRLDALVTGVVVLARTSKAAARLNEQFRDHAVAKTYLAVVEGSPPAGQERLVDSIAKDDRHHRMVVLPNSPGAEAAGQEARLRFRVLERLAGGRTLLSVNLETGRKHQIRLQLAHRGWPVVGDARYGAARRFPRGIALHARKLQIQHPTTKESLSFQARLPSTWRTLGLDEDSAARLEAEWRE